MRFLTGDYLYPLHVKPLKEGVLQISDKGEIIAVFKDRNFAPKEKLEIFKGILCPGVVNAHCHLELSHLKGVAKKGTGFLNFIESVQKRNDFKKEEILAEIALAEQEMIENGIVGVGDICNTTDTLYQKQKGNLQYYNFIEVFGVQDERKNQIILDARDLRNQFRASELKSTISPHSPYSVPPRLMQEIARNFDEKDELFTIHIQETLGENELFEKKKGALLSWLQTINASSDIWENRNKSTYILKELGNKKILLVHNTFAKKEDISANYYCTCPKANLYIEN
ncbi:MAG: amidohydrolase family protein, partial [Bacteroidota bacterium]|nr:amidohydrolase family protein [Bacteroidota bacterium]